MGDHRQVETVMVLAKQGAETATLFCVVDGVSRYETLNERQLLWLIQTAAESLGKLRGNL